MKKQCLAKLISQAGESIGETLIALLISALALIMLAGAVDASTRVVTKSKVKMADYYTEDMKLMNVLSLETEMPSLNITFTETDDSGSISQAFEASYAVNAQLGGVEVIAYAIPTSSSALEHEMP